MELEWLVSGKRVKDNVWNDIEIDWKLGQNDFFFVLVLELVLILVLFSD
jgi:hypothetical protein